MTILDYTSYEQVRAVIGVSDEEVSDEELALTVWATLLTEKLSDISDSVLTKYGEIVAKLPASRTALEVKFYETVRLFSAYCVAQELLVALPMFSFQSVTDGKASQQRFDRWDDIKSGISGNFNVMRNKVRLALASVESSYAVPTAVSKIFIATTGIATDPVTGI